jgi:hypothetical protein
MQGMKVGDKVCLSTKLYLRALCAAANMGVFFRCSFITPIPRIQVCLFNWPAYIYITFDGRTGVAAFAEVP